VATVNKWNDRYRASHVDELKPLPLVREFTQALTPGVALDLACGPGRNAIYLSDLGWRVTALDASPVAIDLLLSSVRERNRSIDVRLVDLEAPEFELPPESFDLILSCYYLQRSLIPGIKSALRPGGLLIMIVFLAGADQPQGTHTRAHRGKLRTFFPDWTIKHYREGESGEPGHQHSVAELVATKP
jgi:tellurite methyltransferase